MLDKSNIIALVGGGKNPKYALNKVIIWDENLEKEICELRFNTNVKNVKLINEKIIVVCQNKIHIINLKNFEFIKSIETADNENGVICVANKDGNILIAFPEKEMNGSKGIIKIKLFDNLINDFTTINENLLTAHSAPLVCLEFNIDSTIIASASENGTLIRLFKTNEDNKKKEFRRGADKANILSISFDKETKFLACSSDKGTIHIFKIDIQNKKNFISIWYFNDNKSIAQFRLKEIGYCRLAEDNSIILISFEGNYLKAIFNPTRGGECYNQSKISLY
jgi:WD40 repeat protein